MGAPVTKEGYTHRIYWCERKKNEKNRQIYNTYEYRQAKRDLRDVESLRQNCGLFDVIENAVPRKNLVAYLGTFQSSVTRNSLIPGRIEVKLVSMESERFILHVYNKIFVLLCI